MNRAKTVVLAGVAIALAAGLWAVPPSGAAHFPVGTAVTLLARSSQNYTQQTQRGRRLPGPVRFRDEDSRGLVVEVWLNGRGPFNGVIDTGAGEAILSERTAAQLGLRSTGTRSIAGLTGRAVSARQVWVNGIDLGWQGNSVPAGGVTALVVPQLPPGVDAIIDPGKAYAPLGFTIDLPNGVLTAFDPRVTGLDRARIPRDGAVVPWLKDGQGTRPFVRLSDGRLALIDTGSSFGLAVSRNSRPTAQVRGRASTDIGGGALRSTRVQPTTVSIGTLVLENVPTDILDGVESGAPVILGRDALHPFRLTFDPVGRLIEIAPTEQD